MQEDFWKISITQLCLDGGLVEYRVVFVMDVGKVQMHQLTLKVGRVAFITFHTHSFPLSISAERTILHRIINIVGFLECTISEICIVVGWKLYRAWSIRFKLRALRCRVFRSQVREVSTQWHCIKWQKPRHIAALYLESDAPFARPCRSDCTAFPAVKSAPEIISQPPCVTTGRISISQTRRLLQRLTCRIDTR